MAFSVINQSRHHDGVLNTSSYWESEWRSVSWQQLTATPLIISRDTVEVVVCHWGQGGLHTVQKDIEIADISLVALTLIRQVYCLNKIVATSIIISHLSLIVSENMVVVVCHWRQWGLHIVQRDMLLATDKVFSWSRGIVQLSGRNWAHRADALMLSQILGDTVIIIRTMITSTLIGFKGWLLSLFSSWMVY